MLTNTHTAIKKVSLFSCSEQIKEVCVLNIQSTRYKAHPDILNTCHLSPLGRSFSAPAHKKNSMKNELRLGQMKVTGLGVCLCVRMGLCLCLCFWMWVLPLKQDVWSSCNLHSCNWLLISLSEYKETSQPHDTRASAQVGSDSALQFCQLKFSNLSHVFRSLFTSSRCLRLEFSLKCRLKVHNSKCANKKHGWPWHTNVPLASVHTSEASAVQLKNNC